MNKKNIFIKKYVDGRQYEPSIFPISVGGGTCDGCDNGYCVGDDTCGGCNSGYRLASDACVGKL